MKHLFILNPIAGGGRRTGEVRAEILCVMEAQDDPWELYETTGVADATRKVREAAEAHEHLRVYACGGDGTLNECVNGAVGQAHVAVTHFPAGTGNDFIKTFAVGKAHFFDLERLLDAEEMALDVIDVDGRYGINICSVGLDARIGADVHQYSGLPFVRGKGAYVVSLLANVVKGITQTLEVQAGEETIRQKFTLICACNGRSYGGTFTPVPDAMPDDGQLDILLVDRVSRLGVAQLVGKYAKGRFREVPHKIRHIRGKSLTIRADRMFVVNVDGEILRRQEVTFTLLPAAVKFFAPRGASFKASKSNNFLEAY
ncbi:MAG: YegS/Rv2252/BmrU family lipid kinase [Oscillospiraceae bacterium]|nr:YegS/Rv2252/BmrU family lipid kinase [Oscillospiraceae bacterium]